MNRLSHSKTLITLIYFCLTIFTNSGVNSATETSGTEDSLISNSPQNIIRRTNHIPRVDTTNPLPILESRKFKKVKKLTNQFYVKLGLEAPFYTLTVAPLIKNAFRFHNLTNFSNDYLTCLDIINPASSSFCKQFLPGALSFVGISLFTWIACKSVDLGYYLALGSGATASGFYPSYKIRLSDALNVMMGLYLLRAIGLFDDLEAEVALTFMSISLTYNVNRHSSTSH